MIIIFRKLVAINIILSFVGIRLTSGEESQSTIHFLNNYKDNDQNVRQKLQWPLQAVKSLPDNYQETVRNIKPCRNSPQNSHLEKFQEEWIPTYRLYFMKPIESANLNNELVTIMNTTMLNNSDQKKNSELELKAEENVLNYLHEKQLNHFNSNNDIVEDTHSKAAKELDNINQNNVIPLRKKYNNIKDLLNEGNLLNKNISLKSLEKKVIHEPKIVNHSSENCKNSANNQIYINKQELSDVIFPHKINAFNEENVFRNNLHNDLTLSSLDEAHRNGILLDKKYKDHSQKNATKNELENLETVGKRFRNTLDNRRFDKDEIEKQLIHPIQESSMVDITETKLLLMSNSKVCYACSTINDYTCWEPNKKTTVKYCYKGHDACITKTFMINGSTILIRDCGLSCDDTHIVGMQSKYETCSPCYSDLCNNAYTLYNHNFILIFIISFVACFNTR